MTRIKKHGLDFAALVRKYVFRCVAEEQRYSSRKTALFFRKDSAVLQLRKRLHVGAPATEIAMPHGCFQRSTFN